MEATNALARTTAARSWSQFLGVPQDPEKPRSLARVYGGVPVELT
jgi:hypothetical protein